MVRKDLLDELDWRVLAELEKDARSSNRAIARRLGVSAPTVAQRIRRMEEVGVIRGYRVDLAVEPSSPTSPPEGLRCAECKTPIHGPARARRFHGKAYAFCCPLCEGRFGERAAKVREGATSLGISAALLGWVVTFGLLGATCMGMGNCVGPGLAPAPMTPCPPGARGREEFLDDVMTPGAVSAYAAFGWTSSIPWEPKLRAGTIAATRAETRGWGDAEFGSRRP